MQRNEDEEKGRISMTTITVVEYGWISEYRVWGVGGRGCVCAHIYTHMCTETQRWEDCPKMQLERQTQIYVNHLSFFQAKDCEL